MSELTLSDKCWWLLRPGTFPLALPRQLAWKWKHTGRPVVFATPDEVAEAGEMLTGAEPMKGEVQRTLFSEVA